MSDRLRALREIVRHMPREGSVTLPVPWLRDLLDAVGDSSEIRLLNLEETAELVGRSVSTVRTWLNTGQLGGFKLNGRSWRIRESALRNFIERQESGEHEPPTVGNGSADLGAWRRFAPPKKGAA